MAIRVGVVGGGISGLACAYKLQKAGVDVTVFERESGVGGRLASAMVDEDSVDLGAQIVSRTYKRVTELCSELELDALWRPVETPAHYIALEGRWRTASCGNLTDFFRLDYLPVGERIRLLTFILSHYLSDQGSFYSLRPRDGILENASDYVTKWVGAQAERRVFDACLGAYHFHDLKELGEEVIRGIIVDYSPKFTFDHLKGGLNTLAEALREKLRVYTDCPVSSVKRVKCGWRLQTGRGKQEFTHLVLATQAPYALELFPSPPPYLASFLGSIHYAASITVTCRVPAANYRDVGFLLIPEEESPLLCSCLVNAMKEGREREKTHLVLFLRDGGARELMSASDEVVIERVLEEWKRIAPTPEIGEQIEGVLVKRWPAAMPKFSSEHIRRVEHFESEEQGNGELFLCGDYLNSPWIEGSVLCGERVAQRIIDESHPIVPAAEELEEVRSVLEFASSN
ncbi:MAG: FAD-dependent oxidoreductase [Chlamydiia bacterium]|nr:FAD-dependent oxidoreductase [Chlamydiia bacterium]